MTTRLLLSRTRVASTNKTAVQPMNASLNFSAPTHKIDCGTDFIGTGDVTVGVWVNSRSNAGKILDNGTFVLGNANSPVNSFRLASDGATFSTSSTESRTRNKWNFITVTRTSAGVVNFRIGKTASGTANQSSGTPTAATTNPIIGNRNAGGDEALSQIKDLKVFNRILTTSEQDALMSGINPSDYSTSIVRDFSLNEGAGTIVYSKNNPALTGTITGAPWSKEVPTLDRGQIGGNLVKNGDLSYVPVVNVAQTVNARWMDGTSSGSTTNTLFGWKIGSSGTVASLFDTTNLSPLGSPSLKLSTQAVSSQLSAGFGAFAEGKYIPVLPSTSYTFTGWMKTNYTSGDSSDGACFAVLPCIGSGGARTTLTTTKVKTTTDWTKYTITFTTDATDRYIQMDPRVYGHTGTATLIMDAWFANITLTPTVNTTRNVA